MPLARRIAALLLVALWVPAMLHCRLEAAGVLSEAGCCEESHGTTDFDHCGDDACLVVEGEFTKPTQATLAVPTPIHCACLACAAVPVPLVACLTPPGDRLDESAAAPPEVARTWVFVARAAPAPRAPAFVS